jgi:stigma-specific protein Stig1
MSHQWDEFSKSLAEAVPRRESLRRLGAVLAGAVLSPLGLETAFAGHQDPCKAFCKCRNKRQQDQCLMACKACGKDTRRLAGTCGGYSCCASGQTSCGSYCSDLGSDVYNCGGCGYVCAPPGPYEYGACIFGECLYECVEGAADCGDGTCTPLWSDPDNCGACGNVCAGNTPYCNLGTCGQIRCLGGQALCSGICVEISLDPSNCGGCGVVCGPGENCAGGLCQSAEPPG